MASEVGSSKATVVWEFHFQVCWLTVRGSQFHKNWHSHELADSPRFPGVWEFQTCALTSALTCGLTCSCALCARSLPLYGACVCGACAVELGFNLLQYWEPCTVFKSSYLIHTTLLETFLLSSTKATRARHGNATLPLSRPHARHGNAPRERHAHATQPLPTPWERHAASANTTRPEP